MPCDKCKEEEFNIPRIIIDEVINIMEEEYRTTNEENLRLRVEYLESFLLKVYKHLEAGNPIQKHSAAYRDLGVILEAGQNIDLEKE